MPNSELTDAALAIARTIGIIGDRWTPLLLHALMEGNSKFTDFQASIGISTGTLSARLRSLEANAIIERVQYEEHPPRFAYFLTERGKHLTPIIQFMMNWETGETPT